MTDSLDEEYLRPDLNNWANKKPGFEAPKLVCGSMSVPWVDWLYDANRWLYPQNPSAFLLKECLFSFQCVQGKRVVKG